MRLNGEVIATRGGNLITRLFGAGYPDFNAIIDAIRTRLTPSEGT